MVKAPKMPSSPTLLSNQNRKKAKSGLYWPLMEKVYKLTLIIFKIEFRFINDCKLKFSSIFEYCPNFKNKKKPNKK